MWNRSPKMNETKRRAVEMKLQGPWIPMKETGDITGGYLQSVKRYVRVNVGLSSEQYGYEMQKGDVDTCDITWRGKTG